MQMKTFFEKFDGPIVLSLLQCVRADRFAFFCLFFVHLHCDDEARFSKLLLSILAMVQ